MAGESEQEPFLDSVLDATVDTILAFASVWVFLFTGLTHTMGLLEMPIAESTLSLAIGLVAFGTTYPFVTGLWPLKPWLDFLIRTAICFFAISFITYFIIVPLSGLSAASKPLQFGIFLVSLLGGVAVSILRNRRDAENV